MIHNLYHGYFGDAVVEIGQAVEAGQRSKEMWFETTLLF